MCIRDRIHYILQEGADDEDNIVKLINLIDKSDKTDEILGAPVSYTHLDVYKRQLPFLVLYIKHIRKYLYLHRLAKSIT